MTKNQIEHEMEKTRELRALFRAVQTYAESVERILDGGWLRLEIIKDGIEHHDDSEGRHDPTCGRCGGSTIWIDCEQCEDGFTHHDCGEDSCACLDPEDNVRCDVCLGSRGRYVCLASREWCDANPLPDRGEVASAALSAEYWRNER